MAERRMFSKAVVNSARFLRLPASARLLYYDLGMAADDDGVVEAFVVCRMTGATEEDLKSLIQKGLVELLDEEDQIALIVDWKKNNLLPKDRYRKGVYRELLDKMQTEREKNDNELYPECQQNVNELYAGRQQTDNNLLTQDSIGKDSTGKDSIVQDSKDQKSAEKDAAGKTKRFQPPSVEEVAAYCAERGGRVDPVCWYDFYLSKGWKVGRSAMKDWRASVRTWERSGASARAAPKGEPSHDLDGVL